MKERGTDWPNQTVGISHGDDPALAEDMKQLIEDEFHPKEIDVHIIGAAVGSHSGPSTLAIFLQANDHKKHPSLTQHGKGAFLMKV